MFFQCVYIQLGCIYSIKNRRRGIIIKFNIIIIIIVAHILFFFSSCSSLSVTMIIILSDLNFKTWKIFNNICNATATSLIPNFKTFFIIILAYTNSSYITLEINFNIQWSNFGLNVKMFKCICISLWNGNKNDDEVLIEIRKFRNRPEFQQTKLRKNNRNSLNHQVVYILKSTRKETWKTRQEERQRERGKVK